METTAKTRKKLDYRIPKNTLREIFPRKLRSPRSFELVYGQLREMILKGKLRKGDKLVQEDMAHAFGVSKIVLSKVYAQLEKDKLVVREHGRKTFVCGLDKGR